MARRVPRLHPGRTPDRRAGFDSLRIYRNFAFELADTGC